MIRLLFIPIILCLLALSCNEESQNPSEKSKSEKTDKKPSTSLFQLVSSQDSNINFSNDLTADVGSLNNLFDFDYFYNGAGVGLIDYNKDGLLDIVFTGNQVANRLYLNKGNLVFEDVTETSGINTGKIWSNSVTIADVNDDGWDDIYISQGGPNQRLQRKNLLFINNQDGTFSEKAEEAGIADMGISTHTVFFDYDNDEDLDCFVMNENELYGVDPINLERMVRSNVEAQYFNSSHLYRNDNGKFTDVTKSSGIMKPIFGLGLVVSDINTDGLLDIYVASDYYLPDALFINTGNGKFEDRIKDYTNQISYYGMGADIADINNDALQDIFVLDMASQDHYRSKTLMASMNVNQFDYLVNKAGFHHQYMFNSLQLNLGNNHYSNVAHITKTAKTDWSWSVLMNDYDLDGDRDIFVTNGYRKYALDNDIQQEVRMARQQFGNNVPLNVKQNLYDKLPSEKLTNIIFENSLKLNFKDQSQTWGLVHPSFSNGSAVGDLDNDGDLDMVVNNIDDLAFLYKNTAVEQQKGNFINVRVNGTLSDDFPRVTIFHDNVKKSEEIRRVRGYRSSQSNIAHFGVGNSTRVDSIEVLWPNGLSKTIHNPELNNLTIIEKDGARKGSFAIKTKTQYPKVDATSLGLEYSHKENNFNDFEKEILLPYKQSSFGPCIAKGDVNNDGKDDIYIGGASGQEGKLFLQNSSRFRAINQSIFNSDKNSEDVDAHFFDIDSDGDLDLYVVSGGNEFTNGSEAYKDRLYINDGNGNFSKHSEFEKMANPNSGGCVISIDFDKDGDLDVVVGNRMKPQNYPEHAPSYFYENLNGNLKDNTPTILPALADLGIVNDIIASDFNADGWMDLIVVGEWSGINFFENKEGIFQLNQNNNQLSELYGWWFSIEETDVNNDGLPDYIVGNVGQNLKFKASTEKPFMVYLNDFDNNGTKDLVLSTEYNDANVPIRGRECSSQQMPFLKQKFPSYDSYAKASLEDIYGSENLRESYSKKVVDFNSKLLINQGDGRFSITDLPIEAQLFPILDIEQYDFNNDGFEDVILSGNIFDTEVETPRLDAISGQILLSNQKNSYIPWDRSISEIYPKQSVKDSEIVSLGDKDYLLFANNNGPILVHKLR